MPSPDRDVPRPRCTLHALARAAALLAVLAVLLAGAGSAAAADSIATAQPLPLGTATDVQLIGTGTSAQPRYWTLQLGLGERIRLDVNQPLAQAVTVDVFRPGVTDATIPTATPVLSLSAASTITPKQGAFYADMVGTWIVRASAAAPTAFALTAMQLQAPTENPVTKAYTTVLRAPRLLPQRLYTATTYDPAESGLVSQRIVRVAANQGDRVKVALRVTNRSGLRVEVFEPGTTDAAIDSARPIATIDPPTNDAATTLVFTAPIAGDYLLRATSIALDAKTAPKPTTVTVQLVDVAPPDLQPPCADEITNIGRTRVKGCLEAGPGGTFVAKDPVTMSGVILEPVGNATMVIDPRKLEVTSKGTFSVVIWNIRLPAGDYFEFSGTQELNLLDPKRNLDGTDRDPTKTGDEQTGDQRGLQWADLQDGRSDIDGPEVGGLPLTGKITLSWGLDNGGQATVAANADIPGWETTGSLLFSVSNDNGLQAANVAFGSTGTEGLTFNARLGYSSEVSDGLAIDVWKAGFKADVGTTVPPAKLAGGEGALEIRDGSLSYVRVGVKTQIPVGSTGIFVTQLGASLRWKPYVAITGFGSVAAGPEVGGVSAIEISGEGGFADGGSCPGSSADGDRWFFDGRAAIAQWFTVGTFGICYQGVERPFVHAYTRAGFSAAGVVEGRASLEGYLDGSRAMMIEGDAAMKVFGFAVTGTVVMSDYGFAACGTGVVKVFGAARRIAVGFERPWAGPFQGGFACPDFSPFRTVLQTRSTRAADGLPFAVPPNAGQVNVIAVGAGGQVPAVDLVDASGTVIASSTSTTENTVANALFIPQPDTGAMLIVAPLDKAGTYRVRAQAGSTVTSLKTSLPLPEVGIDANVRTRGARRVLDYRLTDLAGRTVEFWEVGDGVARRIGTARGASGSLSFTDPESLGGKRVIKAMVLTGGVPSPERTVARFTSPRLRAPAAPAAITATRRGGTLTLRWARSARATSYRLRVVDTDGRRIDVIIPRRAYRLPVSAGDRLLVEVTALGYGELRSTPTRSRVRVAG